MAHTQGLTAHGWGHQVTELPPAQGTLGTPGDSVTGTVPWRLLHAATPRPTLRPSSPVPEAQHAWPAAIEASSREPRRGWGSVWRAHCVGAPSPTLPAAGGPASFANQTPDCNPRGRPPRASGSEGPGWEQQPGPWACGRPRGAQFTGQRGPGEGGPRSRAEESPGRSWRQKRCLLALERG